MADAGLEMHQETPDDHLKAKGVGLRSGLEGLWGGCCGGGGGLRRGRGVGHGGEMERKWAWCGGGVRHALLSSLLTL